MKKNKYLDIFLNYGMIVVMIVTVIVFSVSSENFFKINTLWTILKQVAITGIIAVGMTFVLLTGGIDLSVGSIAGVTAVTAAIFMTKGFSIPITILIALLIAAFYGFLNAIFITKLNIPPFIATLATQISLRGLAFIVTDGLPVFGFNKAFGKFAQNDLFSVPYPVLLCGIVFIVGIFFLSKTTGGRYLYGVGGNEEASRLSGINVNRMKMLAYMANAFLAGIAGLVLLSRTNSGQPSAGSGYEMDAITSCVLGGISLAGGEGKLPMVIVGTLLMGTLSTGMIMLSIDDYVQQLVKGIVLIAAVAYSQLTKKIKENAVNNVQED